MAPRGLFFSKPTTMPTTDRTFIPRSSPFKSKGAGASTSNIASSAPISLRGSSRPVSMHTGSDKFTTMPSRAVLQHAKNAAGTSNRPRSSSAAPAPSSSNDPAQKPSGSRIPGPFRSGVGLGFSLPSPGKNSPPKTVPRQLPPATSRFHVPLIHSPAPKPLSVLDARTSINRHDITHSRTSTTITAELINPPSPQPSITREEPPWTGPALAMLRTPSMESTASSVSVYTSRSVQRSGVVEMREDEGGDERGGECAGVGEQSPGFGMIEALANQERCSSSLSPVHPRSQSHSTDAVSRSPNRPDSPSPASSGPRDTPTSAHADPQFFVTTASPSAASSATSTLPSKLDSDSASNISTPRNAANTRNAGHPLAVLHELEILLGKERVVQWIDVEQVLEAYEECIGGVHDPIVPNSSRPVFGALLSETAHYANCSTVLGGRPHNLPLVVFAAVEELYRAGLRSPRLLRPPPHSSNSTFPALVAAFNGSPTYGDDIDLARAPVDDVGALLLTYFDCLPGPVMGSFVRDAFFEFCVKPAMESARKSEAKHVDEPADHTKGANEKELRTAQLILHLLPAPHFSLLVYLLAFLSQIPLHEQLNGWSVSAISGAFARVVVGVGERGEDEVPGNAGGKNVGGDVNEKGKGKGKVDWVTEEHKAVTALEWLLRNWDNLSDGLFKEDVGGTRLNVPHQRAVERRPSRVFGVALDNSEKEKEKELHRAAALSSLDPTPKRAPNLNSNSPRSPHTLLACQAARITELERANAEWQWLQEQHEAELRAMFDEGERQLSELRVRMARAVEEERAVMEHAVEDAVLAERRRWVGEVQALREGCHRMGRVWDEVTLEREGLENIVDGIVGRFAKGAPKRT